MSTNQVNENPQPSTEAQAAPPPAAELPARMPENDDPLMADLRAAQADVVKETQGAPAAEPAPVIAPTAAPQANVAADLAVVAPNANTQAAPVDASAAPAHAEGQAAPMIPKARLDEVLNKLDTANARAMYFEGVATALQGQGAPQQGAPAAAAPAATGPTPEEQVTALETRKLELADDYENGKLTMRQLEEQRIEADRQIRAINDARHRAELDAARNTASTTAQTAVLQTQVDSAAVDIGKNNPIIAEIDSHPNRAGIWNFITGEARRAVMAKGMNPEEAHTNLRVRLALMTEKATLANQYGPVMLGKSAQTGSSTTPNPQPAPAPTAAASPVTADQRMAKVDMAASQPPQTSVMGSQGNQNEVTEADIMKMSDDEIAALPASIRRKFTGA